VDENPVAFNVGGRKKKWSLGGGFLSVFRKAMPSSRGMGDVGKEDAACSRF
jgi:hypothetical protein